MSRSRSLTESWPSEASRCHRAHGLQNAGYRCHAYNYIHSQFMECTFIEKSLITNSLIIIQNQSYGIDIHVAAWIRDSTNLLKPISSEINNTSIKIPYTDMIQIMSNCVAFARLVVSSNHLKVETGSWTRPVTPVENRLCGPLKKTFEKEDYCVLLECTSLWKSNRNCFFNTNYLWVTFFKEQSGQIPMSL